MRRLLSRSLEDRSEGGSSRVAIDDKTVVLKGPLSDAYTKALDIAFAKNEEGVATENFDQQEAAQELAKVIHATANDAGATNEITVFASDTETLSPDDVVDITMDLVNADKTDVAGDYVIIIDDVIETGASGATGSVGTNVENRNVAAVEALASKFNAKFIRRSK